MSEELEPIEVPSPPAEIAGDRRSEAVWREVFYVLGDLAQRADWPVIARYAITGLHPVTGHEDYDLPQNAKNAFRAIVQRYRLGLFTRRDEIQRDRLTYAFEFGSTTTFDDLASVWENQIPRQLGILIEAVAWRLKSFSSKQSNR